MAEREKRKINVTEVNEVATGEKNGKPWTLYEIKAAGVNKPLKCFDKLPLGEGEYEYEPYTNPKGEVSYTLFKRRERWISEGEFNALVTRVDDLEAKLGKSGVLGSAETPPVPGPTDEWGANFSERSAPDDDIPF